MLDIDRAQDIDLAIQQQKDILVPFGEAGALDVGVGELVDECNLRRAREHGVDVHLGEEGALVLDLAARHLFKFCCELRCAEAAVCFHNADHDVFASIAAADALAQHAERLADAGCVPKKDLEATALLLGLVTEQPLFRRLALLRSEVWHTA